MDTLDAVLSRRGVLTFRTQPVEPEKLDLVLQAAANAPTPANLQPWAFVAVTEPARARQVASYLVRTQADCVFRALLGMPDDVTERQMLAYEGFENAPCFVVICLQPKVEFALPEHRALLRDWYLVSLGGALANLMTAAAALGLGTRLFGGFGIANKGEELKAILRIPPEVEVAVATPLGYFDEGAARKPPEQDLKTLSHFRRGDPGTLGDLLRGRLPAQAVVHKEQW